MPLECQRTSTRPWFTRDLVRAGGRRTAEVKNILWEMLAHDQAHSCFVKKLTRVVLDMGSAPLQCSATWYGAWESAFAQVGRAFHGEHGTSLEIGVQCGQSRIKETIFEHSAGMQPSNSSYTPRYRHRTVWLSATRKTEDDDDFLPWDRFFFCTRVRATADPRCLWALGGSDSTSLLGMVCGYACCASCSGSLPAFICYASFGELIPRG